MISHSVLAKKVSHGKFSFLLKAIHETWMNIIAKNLFIKAMINYTYIYLLAVIKKLCFSSVVMTVCQSYLTAKIFLCIVL